MKWPSLLPFLGCLVQMQCAFAEEFVDASGKKWRIQVEGTGSPVFFIPHSNEKDALVVARNYLRERKRGRIVWLDCGGNRMCDGIDPNRYFGHCTRETAGMVSFRKKIFGYFPKGSVVITLHSNKSCEQGSVICTKNPYRGVTVVNDSNKMFPSDIIIYNGRERTPSGTMANFSGCLKGEDINQFYEIAGAVDDCSMSEAATREARPYFNIDYAQGGAARQRIALEKALKCFSISRTARSAPPKAIEDDPPGNDDQQTRTAQ